MPFETFFIYVILVVLAVANGFLIFSVFKLKQRLDGFLRKGEQDIGEVLTNQITKVKKQSQYIKEISEKTSKLEQISQRTFQKIGIIRFNPFAGVGGDQSFSIALLDFQDNGFVITSQYGRDFNRIYAKPIKDGKSQYSLSAEEKQAIEQAIEQAKVISDN